MINMLFLNATYNDSWLKQIAKNATNNGFLTFILGAVFVLSIYHFILYFQNKDKSYLYYSIYTFLILIASVSSVKNGFLNEIVQYTGVNIKYADFFRWSYNCIYFLFAVEFLNIKAINEKWSKLIIYPVLAIFGLGVIAQISLVLFKNDAFHNFYSKYYLVAITLHTLFSFYFVFKLKNFLKYYIIVGALLLFLSSIIGEHSIRTLPFIDITIAEGDFFFYIGVLLENICFSLGLGLKQKIILEERNKATQTLINQLKENETLKETVNLQLKEKIKVLNTQIEFKQEIADLKLKALRSQMNPHFIFNSLNSIKLYIINNDKENAVYYLNKFAKLIRKILTASIEKEITLEEEIETSMLYLNIENIRFNNAIEYTTSIDPKINIKSIKIPSLILQPFLENALWHGLSAKEGKKSIDIIVESEDDDFARISIVDNGIGRKASEKINSKKFTRQKSVGIDITKERLINFSKKFNNSFSLKIEDLKDVDGKSNGTRVVILIPVKKEALFL